MGWWGDMGGPTQRGIIQYSVSPFQQNAMKGALHQYVFYGFKRIMQQAPYFVVPFAAGKSNPPPAQKRACDEASTDIS